MRILKPGIYAHEIAVYLTSESPCARSNTASRFTPALCDGSCCSLWQPPHWQYSASLYFAMCSATRLPHVTSGGE